ncbi:hypothetical protein [Methylobacterium sp. CCH5-D2]|uniref:hypothetical protein n=1 Tax=Methylobacterium sp. CCH5-D2 TaxID=1768765 RepID=UPI00082C7233|nr:hypothetical protein [Methylobacterium sp. CCH5-D2]
MSLLPHSTDNVIRLAQVGLRPQAPAPEPKAGDLMVDERAWCDKHLSTTLGAARIVSMPRADLMTNLAALRESGPAEMPGVLGDIGATILELERMVGMLSLAQDRIYSTVAALIAAEAAEVRQ